MMVTLTRPPHRAMLAAASLAVGMSVFAACGGSADEPDPTASDAGNSSSAAGSGDEGDGSEAAAGNGSGEESTSGSAPGAAGACEYVNDDSDEDVETTVDPPPGSVPANLPTEAELVTSAGSITITLDGEAAPCTVNSFVSLSAQGFYDESPCHRLTTQGLFSLQCGDPTGTGSGGPGYRYASEKVGKQDYSRGSVAMATTPPDINGSQFFLIYDDSELPSKYTVFGTIDEAGLSVLEAVADEGTKDGLVAGEPKESVVIDSVIVGS